MKNLPAWIPNVNAWMSAILLLLLLRGIKFAIREIFELTGDRLLNLLSSNSHIVLYFLLLLSLIVVIAIANNLLHIFNPLMLICLVCAAYIYQFEYLIRTHLMAVGAGKG